MTLEDRVAELPTTAGVYLFKDRRGRVIYVGKAINLRARVRQYLSGVDERGGCPPSRFLHDIASGPRHVTLGLPRDERCERRALGITHASSAREPREWDGIDDRLLQPRAVLVVRQHVSKRSTSSRSASVCVDQ